MVLGEIIPDKDNVPKRVPFLPNGLLSNRLLEKVKVPGDAFPTQYCPCDVSKKSLPGTL